jgi:hypothetical protein
VLALTHGVVWLVPVVPLGVEVTTVPGLLVVLGVPWLIPGDEVVPGLDVLLPVVVPVVLGF